MAHDLKFSSEPARPEVKHVQALSISAGAGARCRRRDRDTRVRIAALPVSRRLLPDVRSPGRTTTAVAKGSRAAGTTPATDVRIRTRSSASTARQTTGIAARTAAGTRIAAHSARALRPVTPRASTSSPGMTRGPRRIRAEPGRGFTRRSPLKTAIATGSRRDGKTREIASGSLPNVRAAIVRPITITTAATDRKTTTNESIAWRFSAATRTASLARDRDDRAVYRTAARNRSG